MDKTKPENKVVLGNEHERGVQPDMGSPYHIGLIVDR
jgi:hypothetical protein